MMMGSEQNVVTSCNVWSTNPGGCFMRPVKQSHKKQTITLDENPCKRSTTKQHCEITTVVIIEPGLVENLASGITIGKRSLDRDESWCVLYLSCVDRFADDIALGDPLRTS